MYTVRLWTIDGSQCVATLADAAVRSWSNRINGPGRFTFTLPVGSGNVSLLQKWLPVTLERRNEDGEDEGIWVGWLESHKRTSKAEFTVFCAGALQIFHKRYTAVNQALTGAGSDDAFFLLGYTNGDDDTGIAEGDGGVTAPENMQAQGQQDLLTMFERIAAATGGEFEVAFVIEAFALLRTLRFVSSLGSDKSGTVTLRFRRDGEPGNTVEGLEEGEDGAPMANRILGSSTAGGGYQYDAPNPLGYPLLEEAKQFNEAQNLDTLTALTIAYGQQRSNPVTDFQVLPVLTERKMNTLTGELETVGLRYGDVVPGDLVTCDFVTESVTVQEARRVAEILVDVDERGSETVRFTLTKTGIFVTSNYLNGDVAGELTRRIAAVERLL
jgi:hypothetical protein